VLEHYGDVMSLPFYAVYRRLRTRLQAVVTEDFLGPKWTRRQRGTPGQEGDSVIAPPQEICVPPEALPHRPTASKNCRCWTTSSAAPRSPRVRQKF
jgi:hypothetical protein